MSWIDLTVSIEHKMISTFLIHFTASLVSHHAF